MVIFTLSITAQVWNTDTKMSPWLHAKYSQEMQEVKKNGGPKRVQGRTVRNYILALVKNSDEAAAVRGAGGVAQRSSDLHFEHLLAPPPFKF